MEANQRIARINAHLHPPNFQVEESSSLRRANCRAKVLHLYDVVNTPGVTADIGHMDTGAV
ncbi:hypothetical protein CRG98_038669, partial [Punica granatum]